MKLRIPEGDFQGSTEKNKKEKKNRTLTRHVNKEFFLLVDEIVSNSVRNYLTTVKFDIKDKEIKMCLQALFSFCSILLGLCF